MTNRWLPVVGFEGLYEVSSDGQVRSVAGCVRKLTLDKDGYRRITLRGYAYKVATLVAAAFLGPRPAGLHVLHRDGSRDNDAVGNLYYGTRSQNMQDAIRHGTNSLHLAKLTKTDVAAIRKRLGNGEKGRTIAKDYPVHEATISYIRHNKTWV